MILKSNYDEIDFNELYKAQRAKSSFGSKSVEDWDNKAAGINESVHESIYIDEFLSRVDFNAVKSVLDFGCGPGTLSLKVAPKVESVYAYDYSKNMLEFTKSNADKLNLSNIKTAQKAFEDDWSDVPICDVVFASRCLEVDDLRGALAKLISKAKKAVYITFKVGASFVDEEILRVMKKEVEPKPDYIYLVNILAQMGYLPKLDFIKSENKHTAATSADELIKKVTWGVGKELSEAEKERLASYFHNGYELKNEPMLWAFVRVDV
ncbi:class I SAM-dependent methyltransferase [Campylobacter sp. RM16187]|uniref:class I SAM-dependent methyltransferase n=1 Tax=Campylobacter sp. RM16187 TaxID=1660063 RepID=UPI0021B67937|nr:class I SAM-dependent methyltransferase [Campylobacter sp. RM16187]QKG28457.1 SAM-dependent methyltransferase [Campylobacter sp. RM16187]